MTSVLGFKDYGLDLLKCVDPNKPICFTSIPVAVLSRASDGVYILSFTVYRDGIEYIAVIYLEGDAIEQTMKLLPTRVRKDIKEAIAKFPTQSITVEFDTIVIDLTVRLGQMKQSFDTLWIPLIATKVSLAKGIAAA